MSRPSAVSLGADPLDDMSKRAPLERDTPYGGRRVIRA